MPHKKQLFYFAMFFVLYELNTYLSNDMIMPAMLQVVTEFHAPLSNVALSLSLYIIGGSLLQIFLGPVADLIGKRKVMLFGNILFLIATLVIPFSHTINQFLAARLFQGMGLCFIFIGYAMIHELFDDVEAVKLTSILSNIAIFAPLAGPVIGSAITVAFKWEFVFIVSGILGVISLYGLYKYMPQGKITVERIDLGQIARSYYNIFTHKVFMFGIFTMGMSLIPLIGWIGLSPAIVIEHMHQSFSMYVIYQSVMFGGFIVSSLLIQKIAGKFSFQFLIKHGSRLLLIGLISASILHNYSYAFMLSMFIYSFGFGLFNGAIVRIALMSTGESSSLSSSAMSLLSSVYMSIGLEVYNVMCEKFDYSLGVYTYLNIPLGIIAYLCAVKYAKMNKDRVWNDAKSVDGLHI